VQSANADEMTALGSRIDMCTVSMLCPDATGRPD